MGQNASRLYRAQDSARHKFTAPPQTLATIPSGNSGTSGLVTAFRVPIPDSRLRVKISVLFVPNAGSHPTTVAPFQSTLWLAEVDFDQSGVSGDSLQLTNIEGTEAAPTTIPAADGLLGYSREFVSIGDAIEGQFIVACANTVVGRWVLQTRIQPDAVRFTDDEWAEICAQFNPYLTVGPVKVA